MGLPARTWIHTFRGAQCPVFDIGDADPAAPTAVVLHGFARSRYDALARLGPLLPFARRFILPDLPGHGDARGRGTRLGADEDCFVSSLLTESTTASLLLVGHSLGATVAIHAATCDALRDRVQGVLALAPYERLRTPLGARLDLRGMPRAPLLGPTIATLALLGIRERWTRAAADSATGGPVLGAMRTPRLQTSFTHMPTCRKMRSMICASLMSDTMRSGLPGRAKLWGQ